MSQTRNYIMELELLDGDDSLIYLEADGKPVKRFFAIVAIGEHGAGIVDNCYRTLDAAKASWPDAIAPRPYCLSREVIDSNYTIPGRKAHARLR